MPSERRVGPLLIQPLGPEQENGLGGPQSVFQEDAVRMVPRDGVQVGDRSGDAGWCSDSGYCEEVKRPRLGDESGKEGAGEGVR